MEHDWYARFFEGLPMEAWRRANPPEVTEKEADFLHMVLNPPAGGKILDVPCGPGRLSIDLAARGFRLTGIDRSELFLVEGREKAESSGLEVEWVARDMRELQGLGPFAGAFCFGNSFGYFDRNGTAEFLAAVSHSLVPGARFVLDTAMCLESMLLEGMERNWMNVGGILLLVDHHYHVAEGRLETEYTLVRNGRKEARKLSHWLYSVSEIRHMLEMVGMETISMFSSLEQEPYYCGAGRLLMVCEKNGEAA
ncbi:MAG: class I SAM-dependent methyltransferase [Deltaproteobacteria bacterium]|nr:class I SAM-dependent methyltransferase [Deltaproteobacteria bacterium]